MRRTQTVFAFCALVVIGEAQIAKAEGDLSLIGYDDRGVCQGQESAAGEPCQSCQPTSAAPTSQPGTAAAGPMILSMGPLPLLYSPAADFGSRMGAEPGFAVVGDGSAPSPSPTYQFVANTMPPCPFTSPYLPPPMPGPDCVQFEERVVCTPFATPTAVYTVPSSMPTPMSFPPPVFAYGVPAMPCNPAVVYPSTSTSPAASANVAYAPAMPSIAGKVYSSPAMGEADRLDHMLQAIHHLEAAGMQAQADDLRRQCDGTVKMVVDQLKSNDAELIRLRQASYAPAVTKAKSTKTSPAKSDVPAQKQVMVQVKLIEVNRTKCRALGFDVAKVSGANQIVASNFGEHCVNDNQAMAGFLELLRKEGLAKVLCAPTLITFSGRPANLECGQEIPVIVPQDGKVAIEYKKVGTQLDIVPIVLETGAIHLELRPRYSELVNPSTSGHDGQTMSTIRVREADLCVEMQSGQTAVLGGIVTKQSNQCAQSCAANCQCSGETETCTCQQASKADDDIELLIVVRPEIVDTAATTKTVESRRQPVVTAAVPPRSVDKHVNAVVPATYNIPADDLAEEAPKSLKWRAPATFTAPPDFFDQPIIPAPFAPQPILIESSSAFSDRGTNLVNEPALFVAPPMMLEVEPIGK